MAVKANQTTGDHMQNRIRLAAAAILTAAALTAAGSPAMARDTGPCVGTLGFTEEVVTPDLQGHVLVDVVFTGDGISTHETNCDGPVTSLRTRNTGSLTAWANLPDKKKSPLYVVINPGADSTITAAGTLKNLGLDHASDVRSATIVWTQPAG